MSLEVTSPLGTLLSYAPTTSTSGIAIDFSGLDANTFNLLNEACSQLLQNKSQDAELRLALTAKNKELESTLSRLRSEKDDMRTALDLAQRNAEAAKALSLQIQTQYEESESNRKQLIQDLAQSRRECQSIKTMMRQSKQMGERSIARQRERFTDAAISSATRNEESQQHCIILPNIFTCPQPQSSSTGLEKQQISELESQRLALLSSNTALRRLCTDAINCFAENVSSITDEKHKQHLQNELFPQGEPLRKEYVLSSKQGNHPAVMALAAVQLAGQKAARNRVTTSISLNGQRSGNRAVSNPASAPSTSSNVPTRTTVATNSKANDTAVSMTSSSESTDTAHTSPVSLDGKTSTSSSSSSSIHSEPLQKKARRVEAAPDSLSKRPRLESVKPSTTTSQTAQRALTSRHAPNNESSATTTATTRQSTIPTKISSAKQSVQTKPSIGVPTKSSTGTLREALQKRRNGSS